MIKKIVICLPFLFIAILFPPPIQAYRVGIDYHATTANFNESAFITTYNDPTVRSTVLSQLHAMANQGIEVISTRLWMSDPPDARLPNNHERLGFPPSSQELANLRQYVQDVASIQTPSGKYLDFYLLPFGNACASLTGEYCNYTWDQTIAIYKQSFQGIFSSVGDLTRPDGKKAVTIAYIGGEIMIGPQINLDKFLIQVYPYFISLANQYGITPSLYFIITPEETNILDNNYIDATYPAINKHKSLYWMYRATEFLRQNNLPLPTRLDFSFYPTIVNSNYETLVKRVFDDLAAVYSNTHFGVAETYYPTTPDKRRTLGTAFINDSTRRNILQEVLFWTTPNSGEDGSNAGFPFDVAAYLPPGFSIPGDLNGDGKVDSSDFNKIVAEFGHPYTIFDYNVLVGNFEK